GVLDLQPPVDVGTRTAAVSVSPVAAPPPISSPVMTVGYPRVEEPAFGPEPMPADEIDCRKELKRLGVAFTEVDAIREGQCGIDHPVKVSAIGSVRMKPAATLTCNMAATFAAWTKSELVPAARW